jgi:predicted acylesterase/phospholipase RssA
MHFVSERSGFLINRTSLRELHLSMNNLKFAHRLLLRNLQLADLVVRVDVRGFTTLDFKASDAIIKRGYEAAEAMKAKLAEYALPEAEWNR